DLQRLAATHQRLLAGDAEPQGAAHHIADLLVIVGMGRHDGAAGEREARNRHPRRGQKATFDAWRELLGGEIIPPVKNGRRHTDCTFYPGGMTNAAALTRWRA